MLPQDVWFSGDPRLAVYRATEAGLLIRSAKTGYLQFVAIQDASVVSALHATVRGLRRHGRCGVVFPFSYAQFAGAF